MEQIKTLDLPANQNCEWYYNYLIDHYKQLSIDQINKLIDIIVDKITPNEYYYIWLIAKNVSVGSVIQKLEDAIIQKDLSKQYCLWFVKDVPGVDVQKFQDAIIQKDKSGYYCYLFAKNIEKANIQQLQEAVIQKDSNGYYCYLFAKCVSNADIGKLQDAVIQKDPDGSICTLFARNIPNANASKLQDAVIQKDNNGVYRYYKSQLDKRKNNKTCNY